MKKHLLSIAITTLCTFGLIACNDDSDEVFVSPPQPIQTGNALALTDKDELVSFNVDQPGVLISRQAIKGLRSGDSLIGIDYRPATGKLYGLGHLGNLYTIDPSTSQAEFKVALVADATDSTSPFTAITGAKDQMAIDFNPAADRLRVVGNDGQNLRINVDTGATFTDGTINGADATITSVAYTNSFAGAASTRMFDIDVKQDRLFLQNPPNDGVLSTSAVLGVNATGSSGFDINGLNNQAFAVLNVGGIQQLYSINLSSLGAEGNAASLIGNLAADISTVRSFSLKPAADSSVTAYGLSNNNQLAIFKPTTPSNVTLITVTGLSAGETLVGIDYRLRTTDTAKSGVLYALSNAGNLYTVDTTTAVASNKLTLSAAADDTTAPFTALAGTDFAVDFNPLADRLRVISNTGQNLRINVDSGQTTTDAALNGIVLPNVSAAAYTNSFQGSITSTQLFDLTGGANQLLLQNPPNDGVLTPIGNLGVSLGAFTGFDIVGGDNGLALAAINSADTNTSTLYKINLNTGAATPAVNLNGTANLEASKIGSSSTPALIDLAILIK